jgi:FAD/FMN-containing dehydrogenase
MVDEQRIDAGVLDALQSGLQGPLVRPGNSGYDRARAVWNGAIDKRPGAIARCAGPSDVLHAVNVARSGGLTVAVRAGGHSFAGHGVCDDGLVIDLGAMKGRRVQPDRRRAQCQAGVLWGELDRETQAFCLATPGGVISHTGVAGLTLGGGIGWLNRSLGLSCDNVVSADVVTADGRLVRASETENADLYWGLRGGGGNFGIVTALEFALHPVGPAVLAGVSFFSIDRAYEIASFTHSWAASAPRALGVIFGVVTAPPEPFVAVEAQGQPAVVVQFCWAGRVDEGECAITPLRAKLANVGESVTTTHYTAWQASQDAAWGHGTRTYLKSGYLDALTGEAAEAMVDSVKRQSSPLSGIFLHQLGGAIRDVAPAATAYAHRSPEWNINIAGVWDDTNSDCERETSWARQTFEALGPYMTGQLYSNFISDEPDDARTGLARRAYGANYARLAALKRKYDPTNLFRLNTNVQPA